MERDGDQITNERGVVSCPKCGEGFLRHDRVTVFSRTEDACETVIAVEVPDTGRKGRPEKLPGNPSARRSGVVIEGWCEECDFRWMFSLGQHKGETFVDIVGYEADKGPPKPRHV